MSYCGKNTVYLFCQQHFDPVQHSSSRSQYFAQRVQHTILTVIHHSHSYLITACLTVTHLVQRTATLSLIVSGGAIVALPITILEVVGSISLPTVLSRVLSRM
uniref:Uncharacterized protein n=1 Tax=Photinus pyralis TaxID=7054 RepID=A0A1Y1KPR3_PHOPY